MNATVRDWALVTGASRGIGAAIAIELARAGHPVVVNYRSGRDAAEAVVATIVAAGGQAEAIGFDVADRDATSAAIEALLLRDLPIGVVVNNAGVVADGPFPAMPWES